MQNNKENMGGDPIADLKLENQFRIDQIDYYRKKNQDMYTKCKESEFIKLANNKNKFKKIDVCDFFTGKSVKENFIAGKVVPMEASEYTEAIEHCQYLNKSLQKNIDVNTGLDEIVQKIQQIPEYTQITTEDGVDKGCGYCYNKNGAGEILYGDSLGPYKNAGVGNVCETWIKPGDIKRGGGTNLKNNKWRSLDDPAKMEFGGNQGVVNDSIKIHEQQICSKVTSCDDLNNEKKICGWCYMGRKGDGKGEGMVAMVDPDDKSEDCIKDKKLCNRIGETKYMDDYCPWPGEVGRSGKPTKKWTGPTEGSDWLKKQAKERSEQYTAKDIQKIDLKLQQDKINKLTARKNDDSLNPEERSTAGKMIKYVKDKMQFIMNFGQQSEDNSNEDYKKWKNNATASTDIPGRGSVQNNKFLYKCGTGNPILEGKDKNIFFLHSYNGLSEEQKVILKGLHETHEFYKKCQTNMTIMGKKITLKDNEELLTQCHKLTNILNKKKNKKLKELFLKLDLSKDGSGCLENCEFKKGVTKYNSQNNIFKNWWTKNPAPKEKCTALSLNEILQLTAAKHKEGGNEIQTTEAYLQTKNEDAPTVENSTCCKAEWDSAAKKFKECSASSKPSTTNCEGGCANGGVTEQICKLYAQDIGLDINDPYQYNPNGYVSYGLPYGCSTNSDSSKVWYVQKAGQGLPQTKEDIDPNRSVKLTKVKKVTDIRDEALAKQKKANKTAESWEKIARDRHNNTIAHQNRLINRYDSKIRQIENEKRSFINNGRTTKQVYYNEAYYENVWDRCKSRSWFFGICKGGYKRVRKTRRTSRTVSYIPWWVTARASAYDAKKAYWVGKKNTAINLRNNKKNAKTSIFDRAKQHRKTADDVVEEAETEVVKQKGPTTKFSNPTEEGTSRTTWYSICGKSDKGNIDYPTQTAKMFRNIPSENLRENKIDGDKWFSWAKIKGGEHKITSFEELIKSWLNSKINVGMGDQAYKTIIADVWEIFFKMVKAKHPGLFVKEASLAKNQVLGNSPLNLKEKLVPHKYEIPELGAVEIEGMPVNNQRQTQPGWRHSAIKGIDASETAPPIKAAGERLMTKNGECAALEKKFPCFKNWQGTKDSSGNMPQDVGYNLANPMGHSSECYNQLWHTQTMKNFETGEDAPSCYQESGKDFITQMGKPFSKYPGKSDPSSNTTLISYTKNIMDKQPIPSVKMDIEKIRKVADTSPQYESIYSLNDISTIQARHNIFEDDEGKKIQISEEARQINRSAKLAALACYNKEPEFEDDNGNKKVPFACKDRFRREDKNFPRPKKCIDYYWEKNTKYPKFASGNTSDQGNNWKDISTWNREKNFHIFNPKYNPYPNKDNDTYGNVWGNANLSKDKFEDLIHFKLSNSKLDNALKSNMLFIKNFKGAKEHGATYDDYLFKKRLIFEYINEREDKIWENLKEDGEQKYKTLKGGYQYTVSGNEPWVKMCWGDFKDALLLEFKGKVKEDGDGTLNLKNAPKLKAIIDGPSQELYRKVINTKDKYIYHPKYGRYNSGGTIKFEIDYPTSITEKMYDKTWFPFWRFFADVDNSVKYYRRVEFNRNERKQHIATKKRHDATKWRTAAEVKRNENNEL